VVAIAALGLLAIACDGDDDGNGNGSGAAGNTLQTVLDRGELKCGVKDSQPGFGNLEDDGTYTGIDIEFCKAVAIAVLGDANAVDYVLATADNRFELLASGEIDVLIRTTTNTLSRDADLNGTFAVTTFYDGQGMMVKVDSGFDSVADMDGATICVTTGTTTEQNLNDAFEALGIAYTPLAVADDAGSLENFLSDRCDGWTGDKGNLAGQRSAYPAEGGGPDALKILPETMSKEPLAPVTRDNDSEWFDIVNWVSIGVIAAEELGVTSANVAQEASSPSNAEIGRLLGVDFNIGAILGLESNTFMQDILAQLGNYGEIYDRTVAQVGIPREGSLNELWTNGGLLYPPPVR
jgi:general L-amino acid transport system substrate-binding protein